MRGLLLQVSENLARRGLVPADRRLLVAVSGGVDSMVLLHVLQQLAGPLGLQLAVAHANHQLRGAAAAADEALVAATAGRFHLPFFCERLDVRSAGEESGDSIEMAARRLRHAFLAGVAGTQKISTVVMAHHADDQAELVLLRLLRGAGGDGLSGMPWRNPSPVAPHIELIRPLLNVRKSRLQEAAASGGVRFREDRSNRNSEFLRNRVRHQLLPLLEKRFNPAIRDLLQRTAELVGGDADFVAQEAEAWLKHPGRPAFENLHPALQRAVLRRQLWALGHDSEFELVERLRRSGEPVELAPHRRVQRDTSGHVGTPARPAPIFFHPDQLELRLSPSGGAAELGGTRIQYRFVQAGVRFPPRATPGTERFAAAKVGTRIVLRHWRPGDRFQSLGLPAPAKLQDLFVNRKIPAARRRALLVATTAGGELFWVESLPPGERFKLTRSTRRQLVWQWRPAA